MKSEEKITVVLKAVAELRGLDVGPEFNPIERFDSLEILELLAYLEEHCGLVMNPDAEDVSTLGSLRKLAISMVSRERDVG